MNNETIDVPRRRLLAGLGALGAGIVCMPRRSSAAESAMQVDVALAAKAQGRAVSPQLIGLSYETRHLLEAGLFSARNTDLIAYFRRLNPQGILRLGGNTSDFAVWSEYRGDLPADEDEASKAWRHRYTIAPAQIEELAGFVRASGWRVIFGVNLKADRPQMAAQLAAEVHRRLGDGLLAIQIGNEPNGFKNAMEKPLSFDEYLALWKRTAQAVREAVPGVALAGPDTGANTDWVLRFAAEADDIAALSRHYYRGGADDAGTTIADILAGDAKFLDEATRIADAGDKRGLPLYLSEVNSYWSGGKLGVSNTLASALWGGDFALSCAQAGVAALQFHGGPLGALEMSLDRTRHPALGEGDDKSRIDGISGRYTAIAGDASSGFYARPLFYGLLVAQQFAGGRFVAANVQARGVKLTAYAADREERRIIALFNKDLAHDAKVRIALGHEAKSAELWRLTAPAIDDVHATTLAGTEVDAHGAWAPRHSERLDVANAAANVQVPRGSAALIFVA
ncbi:MAG: hypothetical protein JSR65_12515 [Proteobacteria bacterium]|nr:hypothetical protein [Pseudomonadota bacterium]